MLFRGRRYTLQDTGVLFVAWLLACKAFLTFRLNQYFVILSSFIQVSCCYPSICFSLCRCSIIALYVDWHKSRPYWHGDEKEFTSVFCQSRSNDLASAAEFCGNSIYIVSGKIHYLWSVAIRVTRDDETIYLLVLVLKTLVLVSRIIKTCHNSYERWIGVDRFGFAYVASYARSGWSS